MLEDAADLTGRGVDVVLGAVAVKADRVGAAAEAGEPAEDTGQGAVCGELAEFREWGRVGRAKMAVEASPRSRDTVCHAAAAGVADRCSKAIGLM